ncbi:hypothetical protein [Streptomyces sp. VRA16 Mangrove soil]|uniref:hypothetical protein n=1 Tax=Streptomyces sp. VRA16 Mangrove soil TaxID=2817434 RepID=UPI001A9E007A|nr:hypothetical protein [Streptomyces sp. VRA16 Mangrove soil]MBO1334394.1 hypothetical protein [Streptomyces sp. VRA16 Mangrove soil]
MSARILRLAVTVHTAVAFGQPAFAGAYLSGDIGGLDWHARGADVTFSLGIVQAVIGVVAARRSRRWWPAVASVLILIAESGQYAAGLAGALWLHIPLGVALLAGLTVLCVTVWTRPLPRAHRDGTDG